MILIGVLMLAGAGAHKELANNLIGRCVFLATRLDCEANTRVSVTVRLSYGVVTAFRSPSLIGSRDLFCGERQRRAEEGSGSVSCGTAASHSPSIACISIASFQHASHRAFSSHARLRRVERHPSPSTPCRHASDEVCV